jgi:inorganic pyrophosphatase
VTESDARFWELADALVAAHRIVIDRPAGSAHPTFPHIVYPFDYGFLEGTGAVDGSGVDCWRGSLASGRTTGAIMTVDVRKGDAEVKWLISCTPDEMEAALATHCTESQAAMLVVRPARMEEE